MGSCACCFRFKKVLPKREVPAAKATPAISSPVIRSPVALAALSKQDKPRPPPSKPLIIEYKYSREIIDLRPADQARNLNKDGSAYPSKKDPIRILSKHILTTGAAGNNQDSDRKLISKPKAVAVHLKKPDPRGSPNPKQLIEISKLQSLRLTRNESTQIPSSVNNEKPLHDLSLSVQSHQSFSGVYPSVGSPIKSDIRAARQVQRNKNVPNLLEKIQKRKIEEKQLAAPSQLLPAEQAAKAEQVQDQSEQKQGGSKSNRSILMSMKRRNKTDTEIMKSEKNIEEATGLPSGPRRLLDPDQTPIRKIELFKASLVRGAHSSDRNLLADILAQGLLELGGMHSSNLLKHSESYLRGVANPALNPQPALLQETAAAPGQKTIKSKINDIYINSSIATISEKYSEEFEAESAEKQSNKSLKQLYPNRQQMLDLKKRNLTDIKDFKKEANLENLFYQDQSKIEVAAAKVEQEQEESEELGDALFKLNDQSFG